MEDWEIELRRRLELELPEGFYDISSDRMIVGTGKQGYINYMVALEQALRDKVKKI